MFITPEKMEKFQQEKDDFIVKLKEYLNFDVSQKVEYLIDCGQKKNHQIVLIVEFFLDNNIKMVVM